MLFFRDRYRDRWTAVLVECRFASRILFVLGQYTFYWIWIFLSMPLLSRDDEHIAFRR